MRSEQTIRFLAIAGVMVSGLVFPGVSLITAYLAWRFLFDKDPTMIRPLAAAGILMTLVASYGAFRILA